MLVAISVFALLVVLLGKALASTCLIWFRTQASVDNLTQARVALDNLQIDLSRAVIRPDLGAFCDAEGNAVDGRGNAYLAFYAERPGTSYSLDQRQVGLVSYARQDDASGNALLRRTLLPVGWGPSLMSFGSGASLPRLGQGSAVVQEAARGVLAMAVKFIDPSGSIATRFDARSSRALTVTLLIVDDRSNLHLNTAQKASLNAAFETEAASAEAKQSGVGALWRQILNRPGFWASYPAGLAGSLKVFERAYVLPSGGV
ncbi:MAG TPA: hypothetical protein VIM58_02810 [Candidatus Methylacidiphilales bacterium]